MARSFSLALFAGGKAIPIKGPNGEPVVFHCDFQWSRSNYLCAPFAMSRNVLVKTMGANTLNYRLNSTKDNYLDLPQYYFSLAAYSFVSPPEYFMFPRYRSETAVFCARIEAEQYLAANTESLVNLYKAAGKAEEELNIAAVPFSQFDDLYRFDTLPTADDGTYWGVKYDDSFCGGIKRIA